MGDIDSLLAGFARRGIRLIPSPPHVIVEPASLLTDQDRQAIRQRKAELLAALTREVPVESAACDACRGFHAAGHRAAAMPPVLPVGPCRSCGGVEYWFSIHGAVVCLRCHPPAAGRLIAAFLYPAAPMQ